MVMAGAEDSTACMRCLCCAVLPPAASRRTLPAVGARHALEEEALAVDQGHQRHGHLCRQRVAAQRHMGRMAPVYV